MYFNATQWVEVGGTSFNTILSGSGAPGGGLGNDGDFYIRTDTDEIYGPKTGGAWGSPTSLVGPQGIQGDQGDPGVDGRTVLNGSGAPGGGTGVDGDFYIDTTADAIYGPKTAGAWGSPTPLVGPEGPEGPEGPVGDTGPQGDPGNDGLGAPYYDAVDTAETTASTSYTDLVTVGPDVTFDIPTDAVVIVHIRATIGNSGVSGLSQMGFALSGANTVAANDTDCLIFQGDLSQTMSGSFVLTGLTPGSTTFTTKYKAGTGTAEFQLREIIVQSTSESASGGGSSAWVWNAAATPNYEQEPIEMWVGPEDPVDDGATPNWGDLWFDPNEHDGYIDVVASDVTFSDSGLVVITGVDNVQTALAMADAALADLQAKADGPIITRTAVLTDVTATGSTSYVQWGTEEVVFDDALWSGDVTVDAWFSGYFTDVDINEFVDARLNISLDNGSTWTAGTPAVESRGGSFPSVDVNNRDGISGFQHLKGTPTGDIQVRAEVRTLTGSNQAEFRSGRIMAICRPAHASDS
jgi:hypothetical protein